MKRVFSSHNAVLAHHARNLLEVEGIETEMRNLMLSSAMGELPPAECQAEVWVRNEADARRAESILYSENRSNLGPAWRCASCGEEAEPQFTQCWNCGAARTAAPG
jgi:hypothetical protein